MTVAGRPGFKLEFWILSGFCCLKQVAKPTSFKGNALRRYSLPALREKQLQNIFINLITKPKKELPMEN